MKKILFLFFFAFFLVGCDLLKSDLGSGSGAGPASQPTVQTATVSSSEEDGKAEPTLSASDEPAVLEKELKEEEGSNTSADDLELENLLTH